MPERKPFKQFITPPDINPQLLEFDQVACTSGAYSSIDLRSRILIRLYLTTDATFADLRPIAGVGAIDTISRLVKDDLSWVIENLPTRIRKRYPKPDDMLDIKKI